MYEKVQEIFRIITEKGYKYDDDSEKRVLTGLFGKTCKKCDMGTPYEYSLNEYWMDIECRSCKHPNSIAHYPLADIRLFDSGTLTLEFRSEVVHTNCTEHYARTITFYKILR